MLYSASKNWGIKLERVELKDVKLPQTLQRAMAAEAEATREARAKVLYRKYNRPQNRKHTPFRCVLNPCFYRMSKACNKPLPVGLVQVIAAEGEMKASCALKEAADVMSESPAALQLRYLQTLGEIATERNSTVVFPIPMDLITSFMRK